MNRDHMLGWPPSLLALDPEPKPVQRTRTYRRTPPHEQQVRRNLDAALTARLHPAEPKPSDFKVVDNGEPFVTTFMRGSPPDEWTYHRMNGNTTTVHRVRASAVEYMSPLGRRWRVSAASPHEVRAWPAVERPAWDPELKHESVGTGAVVCSPDIRVRAKHKSHVDTDLYRLINGEVHYWSETSTKWCRPVRRRDWSNMVPASSVQLQRLPSEAFE